MQCWSTGIRLGKRLLQEIQRRIIEDAYQSTQFHTVSMPFEVCFVCVWGFFTTRVHKTERSKIQHYERTCDWHGVLLVEDRCRTTSWRGSRTTGFKYSMNSSLWARQKVRHLPKCSHERVRLKKWFGRPWTQVHISCIFVKYIRFIILVIPHCDCFFIVVFLSSWDRAWGT